MVRKIIFIVFWLLSVSKLASIMIMDDPDLWGHVLYGTKHLSTGSLPLVDQLSYTADGSTWINHEWLSEFIFAYLWNSLGTFGLLSGLVAVQELPQDHPTGHICE